MRMLFKIIFGAVAVLGLAIIGLWVIAPPELSKPARATPAAAAAPSFAFRDLKSGMSLAEAKAAKAVKDCIKFEGQTTCDLADNDGMTVSGVSITLLSIAGAPTFGSGVYFDRNGVFSGLDVFTYQNRFAEVSSALTSAYGETCRFDVKQLHNAFNAQYSSIEATWCFDGGALTFIERSSDDLTHSVLSYAVDRPPQAPRQFTPAEL